MGLSPIVQLNAVRRGVGIGIFPTYLADGDSTLQRVLENKARAKREFWLAIHEDLRDTPRMAAVFNFIKEIFVAHPAFYR
jgi:DNA-binding transcriptional LysR family regulator